MTDRTLTCRDCGKEFPFKAEEAIFFERKGFQEPKRCKACRKLAKTQREAREHSQAQG